MITAEQIEKAKRRVFYNSCDKHHEHDDCIRIAYAWLDAQKKISNACSRSYPLKHLIENWAGRYVSEADVVVAAELHPEIHGSYPTFNISSRLTEPSCKRLVHIDESYKHKSKRGLHDPTKYQYHENPANK